MRMQNDACFWAIVCRLLCVLSVGVLWPNGWMDQDESWHGGRPWPRPHRVKWGLGFPPEGAQPPPIFGPCLLKPNGRWIKMPLGMKVGLGPGDIVLDGDPAPTKKGAQPPIFRSSPGDDDLIDWNSGVSVHPSIRTSTKSFSDFDLIWCVGRRRPDMGTSVILTRSQVKVQVIELMKLRKLHFLGLSPPPFLREARN